MARTRLNQGGAVLSASAFVIAAMIIVQAGRLPGQQAYAEMSSERGSYTMLTTDAGIGGDEDPWEVLYVIDSRQEVLLVYFMDDARQKRLTLRDGGSLRGLFRTARGR
jgi:hypothetical protein